MKDSIREKHKIISWFTANPVVANILMLCVLAAGAYTAFTVRKEAFPSFDAERVTISIPVRGGNPEDVERGITVKVEEALQNVDGIDNISSTSSENNASIVVEAVENYDLTKLLNDVKIQVDAIDNLPEQAENPVITETKRSNGVLWVEVTGDQTEKQLKETARNVRDALLAKPNITQVSTFGSRDYEISVEVSEEKLKLYSLTFNEVANAISANSIDLSSGSVKSDRGEISLRIRDQAYTKADFDKLTLRTSENGTRIYLKDVANVIDGFEDQKFLNRFNGKPTISLRVTTQGNDDIIKAVVDAKAVVEEYTDLPENVELRGWLDGSQNIRDRLSLLTKNGITGVVLVLITLTIFLNLRLAFWVAIGIPVSFAGAFILFPVPGVDLSLNLISAFGFIIVLGIVVDDAIVIGESIFTEKKNEPSDSGENAITTTVRGISKVVTPATFGVITTIAAFLPLTQVSGRQGNIFGQLATVVIFCLIFSLIESKLILPAHLSHLNVHKKPKNTITKLWAAFQGSIEKVISLLISKILTPTISFLTNWRYAVVTTFIAIFMIVISMLSAGKIRQSFFPDIFRDSISLNIVLEQGLSVDYLHETASKMATSAAELGVEYKNELGSNPFENIQVSASSNNSASIVVQLSTSEENRAPTPEIVKAWRKKVGPIAGARSVSFSAKAGPQTGDLTINLESKDLEELQLAAEKLKQKLNESNGVFDVYDSFDSGKPEIRYSITPEGQAADINKTDLASNIRNAFFGREAQRVQRDRDEVRVMVRYPEEKRSSLDTLRDMRIRKEDGTAVPFSVVADTKFGESLASIKRYNSKRVVSVQASVDKSITSAEEVQENLSDQFFQQLKAEFPSIEITQTGRAEERAKSQSSLRTGFAFSLILIYVLIAIPLKSYVKPIVIMSVIPFGIIGALLGHYLMDIPVSILSMFGILALSGVVVNDSLVFVSRVMDLEDEGYSIQQAVVNSVGQRFRAIFLTTLTTFLGLFPILFEKSTQAQFLKPMATSLAFGITFATFITLILLPMLILILNDIKNFLVYLYGKKS